ncbi:Hypothetical predicted protein [Olea europaea subsp. europaea]|uniref:Uncharacterized protein n=1 Tax=Olea europaea subsp. europaea TaxID=158383 RepID=A0A8S0R299_OLEEU|nr:Hypothetical predicted protein [Olea europaea subsp. europaea]
MEANACDVSHLDADALLPPRKRLLAGLKRRNSDLNCHTSSASCNARNLYDDRLNNVLRSNVDNPNLSNEELVEASRLAAIKATKAAEAARAIAEEKAAKAAKAVAAAKSALELVASLSDESANKEKYLKKNKMKKHVPVQTLYNKHRGISSCKKDEELARKLHSAINSSPRISKNFPSSDLKNHKHKRLKSSASERTCVDSGGSACERNQSSMSNGNGSVGKIHTEGLVKEVDKTMVDLNTSKFNNDDQPKLENGEGSQHKYDKAERLKSENEVTGTLNSKENFLESLDSFGKKRGRIKQKKLPLSICSFRDQTSLKVDLKSKPILETQENARKAAAVDKPPFTVGSSGGSLMPVERTSMWKCQAFKTPGCVKQNKVMQS